LNPPGVFIVTADIENGAIPNLSPDQQPRQLGDVDRDAPLRIALGYRPPSRFILAIDNADDEAGVIGFLDRPLRLEIIGTSRTCTTIRELRQKVAEHYGKADEAAN
jgi:hypothetical protein